MQFTSWNQRRLTLKFIVLFMSLIHALISTTDVHASAKEDKQKPSSLVLMAQRLIDDYKGQGPNLEKAGELLVRAAQLDSTYARTYVPLLKDRQSKLLSPKSHGI